MKILQMPCIRDASMKALPGRSWEVLVSRSCKILSGSSRSLWGPGMTILVKVFYDSLWEALVQILVKSFLSSKRSLHDLVQWYRSLWEDLVDVPLKSMRPLHKDFEDALCWCLCESSSAMFADHRKFFYEDLVRYPIQKVVLLRSFEILLHVPVWGSGVRPWWVDSVASFATTNSCCCSSDNV